MRKSETGFATAEFAVATPAVVLVLAIILGGLQAVSVHHQALHGASVGARLAARGESDTRVRDAVQQSGSSGGGVQISKAAGLVTVRVEPTIPAVIAWAVPDLSADVRALAEKDLAGEQ